MDARGGLWAWGHLTFSFGKVAGRPLWQGPRVHTWGGQTDGKAQRKHPGGGEGTRKALGSLWNSLESI